MSKTYCQAKDPSTCPYHGTLENHETQAANATSVYVTLLKQKLSDPKSVSASQLEKAKTTLNHTVSLVDAHEENFLKLTQKIEELEKETDEHSYDDKAVELRDLLARKIAAKQIRNKKFTEELTADGWKTETVRNLPINSILETGERVVSVHRRVYLPASKREVSLADHNGKVRTVQWNSNTRIDYKEPEIVSSDTDEDPWGLPGQA